MAWGDKVNHRKQDGEGTTQPTTKFTTGDKAGRQNFGERKFEKVRLLRRKNPKAEAIWQKILNKRLADGEKNFGHKFQTKAKRENQRKDRKETETDDFGHDCKFITAVTPLML